MTWPRKVRASDCLTVAPMANGSTRTTFEEMKAVIASFEGES